MKSKFNRLLESIVRRLSNRWLCVVTTIFWRVDRIRNTAFPEIECRWPKVFLAVWRGRVIARVATQD